MKIKLNKNNLAKTLSHLNSIVEKRNIIPILSNIKLEAISGKLSLTSTDMDMSMTESIEAFVEIPGSISVSSQMLYDIVRKSDNYEILLEVNINTNQLVISCGNSEFRLPIIPSDNFPNIDSNDFTSNFSMKSGRLKFLISKTKFSIPAQETRYFMNGIYFHKEVSDQGDIYLAAVTTDGHRLSKAKILLTDEINFEGFILPKKTSIELAKLLENDEDEIRIEYSNYKVKYILNNIILISKLIDASFPDYQNIISKENNKIMSIKREDLAKSVDRVSILSSDSTSGVKLKLNHNHLTLLVNNQQSGQAREELKIDYEYDPLEISFNSRYISDILSVIDEEIIQLYFSASDSSASIKSPKNDNYLYILMPMRI